MSQHPKPSGLLGTPFPLKKQPKRKAPNHAAIFQRPKRRGFQLSKETKRAIELVKTGKHVEMIGQAGTGKSTCLKRLARTLQSMRIPYVMTASTGRAALNIGGQTIHSFSGAGIGDEELSVYIAKVTKSPWYKKAWNRPKVLIIEEISMLGMKYFELLDKVARAARKCDKPFGGLQLVVCGDYMQLPPVNAQYVFNSQLYKEMFGDTKSTVVFNDIKRQSCPRLIKILQEARVGKLSQESVDQLKACVDKDVPETFLVKPMILYAQRTDVRGYNMEQLNKLEGDTMTFQYTWQPSSSLSHSENEFTRKNLERNVQAPTKLELRVGAQVMMVRNMPELIPPKFNGSMGVVTSFHKDNRAPVVKFTDGAEVVLPKIEWKGPKGKGIYIQYPLILGWALTIHKAQGEHT
jgi:ATP-dependent DNA helicase PIF1